jgi:hypothetical protein
VESGGGGWVFSVSCGKWWEFVGNINRVASFETRVSVCPVWVFGVNLFDLLD